MLCWHESGGKTTGDGGFIWLGSVEDSLVHGVSILETNEAVFFVG